MNKKINYGFVLLMIILLSTFSFANPIDDFNKEIEQSIEVREWTLWDSFKELFSVGSYSTAIEDGTFLIKGNGELYDLSFKYICNAETTTGYQKFAVAYNVNGIIKNSYVQIYPRGCTKGTYYVATLKGQVVPDLGECGTIIPIVVRHEVCSPSNVCNIDTTGDNINGFELVRKLKYQCNTNVCEGLTGKTVGSKYCYSNDVMQDKYTDIVKDGKCLVAPYTTKNCGSAGCSNGVCNQPPIQECYSRTGYVLKNNACSKYVDSTCDIKPSGYYTTLTDCQNNIIESCVPSNINGYELIDNKCVAKTITTCDTKSTNFYDNLNLCNVNIVIDDMDDNTDNETDSDDNTNEDNSSESIWTKIWNWILSLFQ